MAFHLLFSESLCLNCDVTKGTSFFKLYLISERNLQLCLGSAPYHVFVWLKIWGSSNIWWLVERGCKLSFFFLLDNQEVQGDPTPLPQSWGLNVERGELDWKNGKLKDDFFLSDWHLWVKTHNFLWQKIQLLFKWENPPADWCQSGDSLVTFEWDYTSFVSVFVSLPPASQGEKLGDVEFPSPNQKTTNNKQQRRIRSYVVVCSF